MTVLAIGHGCGCAICATVSSRLPVFRVVTPDRLLTSDNDFENRAPSLCEQRRVGIHNARTKTNASLKWTECTNVGISLSLSLYQCRCFLQMFQMYIDVFITQDKYKFIYLFFNSNIEISFKCPRYLS